MNTCLFHFKMEKTQTLVESSEGTTLESTSESSLSSAKRTTCEPSDTLLPDDEDLVTPDFKRFCQAQKDCGLTETVPPVRQAVKLKNVMLQYCLKHKITNLQALHGRPIEETADYFMHPRFNSVIGTIFAIVSGQLRKEPFTPKWRLLSEGYVPKIENFLRTEHGFAPEKTADFARKLTRVINRRSGKRNTFWVHGTSNAGKTQLMLSFVNAYFPHSFGVPNNSIRTQFTFNDCMNRRVILWEEPFINADNIEDCKLLFGGQDLRTDAKYQTSAIVESTPVIITSNSELWKNCHGCKDELSNRCYTTRLWKKVKGEKYFPLCKRDWDEFFSFHREFIKKDCGKLGLFDDEDLDES